MTHHKITSLDDTGRFALKKFCGHGPTLHIRGFAKERKTYDAQTEDGKFNDNAHLTLAAPSFFGKPKMDQTDTGKAKMGYAAGMLKIDDVCDKNEIPITRTMFFISEALENNEGKYASLEVSKSKQNAYWRRASEKRKILFINSTPKGGDSSGSKEEIGMLKIITSILYDPPNSNLVEVAANDLLHMAQKIEGTSGDWIIHYTGHGLESGVSGVSGDRRSIPIKNADIVKIIKGGLPKLPAMIMFSACNTHKTAKYVSAEIGPKTVVIGTTRTVEPEEATAFSTYFYQHLAEIKDIMNKQNIVQVISDTEWRAQMRGDDAGTYVAFCNGTQWSADEREDV